MVRARRFALAASIVIFTIDLCGSKLISQPLSTLKKYPLSYPLESAARQKKWTKKSIVLKHRGGGDGGPTPKTLAWLSALGMLTKGAHIVMSTHEAAAMYGIDEGPEGLVVPVIDCIGMRRLSLALTMLLSLVGFGVKSAVLGGFVSMVASTRTIARSVRSSRPLAQDCVFVLVTLLLLGRPRSGLLEETVGFVSAARGVERIVRPERFASENWGVRGGLIGYLVKTDGYYLTSFAVLTLALKFGVDPTRATAFANAVPLFASIDANYISREIPKLGMATYTGWMIIESCMVFGMVSGAPAWIVFGVIFPLLSNQLWPALAEIILPSRWDDNNRARWNANML